jgi:hypothetical protein
MSKENYLNDTFKTIGTILVVMLPLLQFGFIWLPEKVGGLYVNKESFFFTSLVTLLLAVFIIFAYRANPYFKFVFNKEQQRKYFESLRSPNNISQQPNIVNAPVKVEKPPFEITHGKLAIFLMAIFLFTAMGFIWIGLHFDSETITPGIIFLQSFLYVFAFSAAIYILIHFSFQEYQRKLWKNTKQERIQRAINLAIENKAFDTIPSMNFVQLEEFNREFPPRLLVQIKVNTDLYNIVTNMDADELLWVHKVV